LQLSEKPYENSSEDTEHLIEAAKEHERSVIAVGPKYEANIDWSLVPYWMEVLEEVDNAAESYNDT
jgi:hypothetical protein